MQSNNNKVWAFLGLVIVVVLIVVGVRSSKNKGADETGPIKIGFISPLSGDAASYGESARNSLELMVEKLNATGGIDGRQVEVIYEDGKCDGKAASLAAQKLVTVDKVQAIIGGLCSGETVAAAPIVEQAKVLLLSPGSSAPAITDAGDYIFRTYPSDIGFSHQLSNLVASKGIKRVALISEQTDYSQGLRNAFLVDMKEKGIEVVADENYAPDTNDFKAIGQKIRDVKPEAIFMNPQTATTATRIAKQLRDLGDNTQLYGVGIFTNTEFAKSGSFVNGMIILDIASDSNKELSNQLAVEYKAKFGKDAPYPIFSNLTYDTLNILKGGIEKVGYNGEKLKNYLYTMKPHVGIIGNISFDKNGDPVGINAYIIKQIQNGEIVDYQQ